MKTIITLFLVLGLSLIQATLLPINFLLILVIALSLGKKAPESFLWAFLGGFFLDLFSFKQLGLSSIFFVSLDFLLKLYRQRFSLDHPLVIIFVLVASYLLHFWFTGREIRIWEGLTLVIILLLIRFFRKELFSVSLGKEGERLKL